MLEDENYTVSAFSCWPMTKKQQQCIDSEIRENRSFANAYWVCCYKYTLFVLGWMIKESNPMVIVFKNTSKYIYVFCLYLPMVICPLNGNLHNFALWGNIKKLKEEVVGVCLAISSI